jgi:polyhydroxybutyrate depolymerase
VTGSVCGALAAIGCASPAGTSNPERLLPGWHERVVRVDWRLRSYLAAVPDSARERRPVAVIIALHGAGGTPERFARVTRLEAAGARARFAVAYLSGIGRTWNAGECCGRAERRDVDDVAYVQAVIDDLATVLPIDPSRVYVTGFSNGALMAYRLACDAADRIGAVVPVAGGMALAEPECRPTRPVSILHIHGTADRFAPLGGGDSAMPLVREQPSVFEAIDFWTGVNDCRQPGERTSRGLIRVVRYAPCAAHAKVALLTVQGLGHQWAGSESSIGERYFGPGTDEVSASALAVSFFRGHVAPRHEPSRTARD